MCGLEFKKMSQNNKNKRAVVTMVTTHSHDAIHGVAVNLARVRKGTIYTNNILRVCGFVSIIEIEIDQRPLTMHTGKS